jgi:GH25 family lysozyme M1 (1,4-beta-N-acetylmuramidase)
MMPVTSPDAHVATSGSPGAHALVASARSSAPATGVDVARYQHPNGAAVDWARVAASGQRFAVVKATELYAGLGGQPVLYTNPYLHADLQDAHAAGLVVGAYAFAHPEFSATAQADDFAAAIGTLPSRSLPPVLDLESSGGLSVPALQAWTQAFLDRLEHDTGVVPMIYTGPGFWNSHMGGTTAFAHYPLWEAHWTSADAPAPFGGWSSYTLWQYTNTAVVPGITGYVDQSRSHGSLKLGSR